VSRRGGNWHVLHSQTTWRLVAQLPRRPHNCLSGGAWCRPGGSGGQN